MRSVNTIRSDPMSVSMSNTFERYFSRFHEFVSRILAWSPDYVVPVAKKGCKLLKASNEFNPINRDLIRYRSYFELISPPLSGKRVAVVDDATQYTATLSEYRHYFERLDAGVRTFSFVGHEKLFEGRRWKYDERAEVHIFLPDPVYQEYILQQSSFLLEHGNQFDLDHLTLEMPLQPRSFQRFLDLLRGKGLLLFVEDYFLDTNTRRFSLNDVGFFREMPYLNDPSITPGPLKKIKFVYNSAAGRLYFSPLIFPTWDLSRGGLRGTMLGGIPFALPFEVPDVFERTDRRTLFRMYTNIYYTYVVSLGKAFAQELLRANIDLSSLTIRRGDIDAMLGREVADRFCDSTQAFLCLEEWIDFGMDRDEFRRSKEKQRYADFLAVLKDMQNGYAKKVRRRKTRIGVHHYLSLESLFARYAFRNELYEHIDYYCDLGVIVPETQLQHGKILRAYRTGEPDPDYNWKRTQVLIPLVIAQFCNEMKEHPRRVEPMLLNKLLANFVYDYPAQRYHELHCLMGIPYTFGTLVHAYHYHRASGKPSIYEAEKISPYYAWDKKTRSFRVLQEAETVKRIKVLFDERQEISYSEIVTYFRFLARIYRLFKQVDVLNLLSVCREENYLYSHVLYNVRTWLEMYGRYIDTMGTGAGLRALHDAGAQATSAADKLRLARRLPEVMRVINERFANNIEFIKALERVNRNCVEYTAQFRNTMVELDTVIALERIATNVGLAVEAPEPRYVRQLEMLRARASLLESGIDLPDDFDVLSQDRPAYLALAQRLYDVINLKICSLAAEEPLLSSRLQNEAKQRAKNIGTSYVNKYELSEATLMFLDFSGLRTIPEPKEDILSRYYSIVETSAEKRRGVKLYGGKDGDDAFTFLFVDVMPALQFAKDIKREFSQDLFLAANGDVKFGMCTVMLNAGSREQQLIECWGDAKDCCEYKGVSFRNRGDLIISHETLGLLETRSGLHLTGKFVEITGERLKNTRASTIFRFAEVTPIQPARH